MKLKPALLILLCCLCFQSCWLTNDDVDPITIDIPESYYEPIIMQRDEFETTTALSVNPEPIMNSGKIYVKDDLIFINERDKGFHVIDNADPANPQNVAFINVLGSSDLSIKGETIYVNNATDLLALSIDAEAGTLEIKKRVVDAFPELLSPAGFGYYNLQENEIVVGWTLTSNN